MDITRLMASCMRLRSAAGVAFLLSLTETLPAQEFPSDTPEAPPQTLRIIGSRIDRLELETASPVTRLTREDLLQRGYSDLADSLRALPANTGFNLNPTDSGQYFAPGVNTLNLRGIGDNGVLFLINGRRATPYATPAGDGFTNVFDLNSIPAAAIEEIQILRDGGSALYGSDAAAGVIDVRLRKDFEGLSVDFEIGNTFDTDAFQRQVSATLGTANGKMSYIAVASWRKVNPIYTRDLEWSREANQTQLSAAQEIRQWWTWGEPFFYADLFPTNEDIIAAIGAPWQSFDATSSRGFPGSVSVVENGNFRTYTFPEPTDNPTTANAISGVNRYNFQEAAGYEPEKEHLSFYGRAQYDFTANLYAAVELSYTRSETIATSASTPHVMDSSHGLTVDEPMYIPAENIYNPWGQDIFAGTRRMIDVGNRIEEVSAETPRAVLAIGGDVGLEWEWETGLLLTESNVDALSRNTTLDRTMQEALLGLTETSGGDLVYDPSTPTADRVYFNWFGYNSEAMSEYLRATNPTSDRYRLGMVDFRASGPIMELPAGPLSVALGGEYRTEELDSIRSELNATGGLLGGEESQTTRGDRDLFALFAEFLVPITTRLEAQIAGRYEDYSDPGFDEEVHPKVGLKFRLSDSFLVRGTFSQSFRAPDLSYLHAPGSTVFTPVQTIDPITGTRINQLEVRLQGNPDLAPTTTDSAYVGFLLNPQDGPLKGFSLSVDYFDFKSKNAIYTRSNYFGTPEFLLRAASGDPEFVDDVVRSDVTNEVLYIEDTFDNLVDSRYYGVDVGIAYLRETDYWGTFGFSINATRTLEYTLEEMDFAGKDYLPKWHANFAFDWSKGAWSTHLFLNYKGPYEDSSIAAAYSDSDGDGIADADVLTYNWKTDEQWVVNPQVSYDGLWGTKVTVGVTNLLELLGENPPFEPFNATGTASGLYYPLPASWYLRLSRDF